MQTFGKLVHGTFRNASVIKCNTTTWPHIHDQLSAVQWVAMLAGFHCIYPKDIFGVHKSLFLLKIFSEKSAFHIRFQTKIILTLKLI